MIPACPVEGGLYYVYTSQKLHLRALQSTAAAAAQAALLLQGRMRSLPPRPPRPGKGFLLPVIQCKNREWLRRQCVTLPACGLPASATPPYTLMNVQQSCASPGLEEAQPCMHHKRMFHVTIPVDMTIRDCNGCIYMIRGQVELDACLPISCPQSECWHHQVIACACVRLICGPVESCEPCFDAQLEIIVDLYACHWEPCMHAREKPACPDLPLYPIMPPRR